MSNGISYIIVIVLISIVIFLITREFWCWYWKINEIRDLLKSINQKLGNEEDNNIEDEKWYCEKCGTANTNNSEICKRCGEKKSKILV